MIKRTLYIGNPAAVKFWQQQLIIKASEDQTEKTVPIEDIGLVVLDNSRISITQMAVNALLQNNSALMWCDEKHMPLGMLQPYAANTTLTENLRLQLDVAEPVKKQAWKQTVQAKIRNQAAVLRKYRKGYETLQNWATEVNSGDTRNVEAKAAYYYWQELFGHLPQFNRGRYEDPPNNFLNYGYAILRAVVARSLCSSGLQPALGIHHRNKYNAFCLADDVMEPYRPLVDLLVKDLISKLPPENWELNKNTKTILLGIPALDVIIDGRNSPLMVAMQRTTASLLQFFEGRTKTLLYPDVWQQLGLKD